jgi:hypothetical protein
MTEKKLTEAIFSMQCSFIAKNAAAWAGDLLTLPERYDEASNPRTVARFTDDMRERLDRLDAWASRPTTALAAKDAEIERLRKAMTAARASIRNARGAVESNQVSDKDVHGTLTRAMQQIDAALSKQEGANAR